MWRAVSTERGRPEGGMICGRVPVALPQRAWPWRHTSFRQGIATAWTSTGTGRGRRRGGIMAVSADLGEQSEVRLPQGIIRYRERGQGSPIVFVHGLLTNGDLWRKVVPLLAREHRCITPDWPLGSHEIPLQPTADLSTPGLGALVAAFITEVGLRDV